MFKEAGRFLIYSTAANYHFLLVVDLGKAWVSKLIIGVLIGGSVMMALIGGVLYKRSLTKAMRRKRHEAVLRLLSNNPIYRTLYMNALVSHTQTKRLVITHCNSYGIITHSDSTSHYYYSR